MRLLTHNQLVCVRKGCQNAFPLQLTFERVELEETEANIDFVLRLLPRVDYPVLLACAKALNLEGYPDELPEHISAESHPELLEKLHTLMLDVHVVNGSLKCPVCEYVYDINTGIPSMKLEESEL